MEGNERLTAAAGAVLIVLLALLVVGPGGGILVGLHKASFVVWFFVAAVHVLARVRHLLPERRVPGTAWRQLGLTLTLVAGAILAIATIRYAHPWTAWLATHRGHDG